MALLRQLAMLKSIVLLFVLVAPGAFAQSDEAPEPVQVMVVGTFHFSNPNLDIVKTEGRDMMTPEMQAQIADVVDALAAFEPTAIAIERTPAQGAHYDSLYAAYRAGEYALDDSEEQQLGFRLADRFDHESLLAIDHRGEFPFQPVVEYAQEHDPDFMAWFVEARAEMEREENERDSTQTLRDILRKMNQPDEIEDSQTPYLRISAVGGGDTYVGADVLSAWYDRNIRIFANLAAVAEPGDRILVIYGAGHAYTLRELIESADWMELVEATDVL
ncbi:MAG: hypothetical protein Rubg2KO_12810 [Rubricoccaceae bacterium]